jgi:hypothetical protein
MSAKEHPKRVDASAKPRNTSRSPHLPSRPGILHIESKFFILKKFTSIWKIRQQVPALIGGLYPMNWDVVYLKRRPYETKETSQKISSVDPLFEIY